MITYEQFLNFSDRHDPKDVFYHIYYKGAAGQTVADLAANTKVGVVGFVRSEEVERVTAKSHMDRHFSKDIYGYGPIQESEFPVSIGSHL